MGFPASLMRFGFYMGVFALGYSAHGCVSSDPRYDVRRYEKVPYLIDKKLEEKIPITEIAGKMQAGTLDYRVSSILQDDRLQEYLEYLKKEESRWTKK